MTVEIWSDVMCPFCYLGKKNYEAALAKFPGRSQVTTVWKSFQLNPDLDTAGINTVEYLTSVKGMSKSQVEASLGGIRAAGEEKGIAFNFDTALAVNTGAAHRLIQLAKEKGKGSEAEELLFKAHFTEGRNVASPEVLVEIGLALGLSEEEVKNSQTDARYAEAVDLDLYEARQLGVRGVPFFVFDRKYAVSGAQPVEVFLQTLEKAGEMPVPVVAQGEACDTNGNCA